MGHSVFLFRISEENFPDLLEYMQSIKGGMKTGLLDAAKAVLAKAEPEQQVLDVPLIVSNFVNLQYVQEVVTHFI